MITLDHKGFEKAIHRSQHCQRNWDLSKEIPEKDLELIMTAITQCPSKQNIAHYKIHAITNREIIESIHSHTRGFRKSFDSDEVETNSQVLANLLLVFESIPLDLSKTVDASRNDETVEIKNGNVNDRISKLVERDKHMAVGIAAGYVNLTASILGYSTGCCACFDSSAVEQILGTTNPVLLLMGIGFSNPGMNRRIHHINHDFKFVSKVKQEIAVQYHS